MSRLPNPRIQSAYTTLPPAIARTGCPSGARMNTPFASVPAAPLGAPNLPVSSPRPVGAQHPDFLPALAHFAGDALEHAAPLAALGNNLLTVDAARALHRQQPCVLRLGLARQVLELGDARAVGGDQRRRGARDVAEVVQRARESRGVIAGERHPQGVWPAAGVTGGEHALDAGLALGERALERAASLRDLRRLGTQALALRLERGERAVGVGDRALGIAQRIARLALFAFPALQFLLQRIDAGTQRLQIFLPRRALRGERGKREREKQRPPQALTLPCADTAAMRFATSSASPR